MNDAPISFLEEVFQELYWKYEADIANSAIILPSTKGAEAFEKIIRNKIHQPSSFPKVLTLESWVVEQSKVKLASTLELLILLYDIFQRLKPHQEPFERFYGWGCMVLQDFDIIDKCLVDPEKLFATLYEQKALTLPHDYLTEAQREAISSFWKTFEPRLSNQQQDFLQLWRLLPQVYKLFNAQLLDKKLGYLGLCYRKLCNKLGKEVLANYQRLFIIGLNALHPAEEKIFAWLHTQIPTEFYWDIDAYYMEDKNQEAGHYLRLHTKKPYLQASFKQPFPRRIQEDPPKITLFEANTVVGQAQFISNQLQQLVKEKEADFKPDQAVIVLASEDLFLPMLHALPSNLQSVNTTLGYPITHTASYQFIEQLLSLQIAIRQPTCPLGYLPSQLVIDLLHQGPIRYYNQEVATQLIHSLTHDYTTYIPQELLASSGELYQALFQPIASDKNIIQYFVDILSLLISQPETEESILLPLERQAMNVLYDHFKDLQGMNRLLHEISIERFRQLFRQLVQSSSLKLNENVAGIQIVRIWETANLDFEYVFILGMNEGNLPANTNQGSFIPYNLRKGYGLPTMDTFQASLDAYYFYRLLQRTSQVYITYATPSSANNQKEMSRYLWQLLYESKLPIQKHKVHDVIYTPTVNPIIIHKDKAVLEKLGEYIAKDGYATRDFTPAALNTYMDCSLKFYFRYILDLNLPSKLLIEDSEAIRFGSLFHRIMEKLYMPLQQLNTAGLHVQAKDIVNLKKQIPALVKHIFSKALYNDYALDWEGQQVIEQEVMQQVISKVLSADEKYVPFSFIGIEVGKTERLTAPFTLKNRKTVLLRGIIDRVDIKEDTVRIIDYKTGGDEKYVENIADLFNRDKIKRNKAFFQTLLYAWIFKKGTKYVSYKIMPGIMNIRSIFESDFDLRLTLKNSSTKANAYIADIADYENEFETELAMLLEEIFDVHIPFTQTKNQLYCNNCPYNRICQRY